MPGPRSTRTNEEEAAPRGKVRSPPLVVVGVRAMHRRPAYTPPMHRTAPRGRADPGEARRSSMRSASRHPAPRVPRWRGSALDWPALTRIPCLLVQDGGRRRRRGGKRRGRVKRPRPVPTPRLGADGPCRRWAAPQLGHVGACCRGGAAGRREAGARSGEGARGGSESDEPALNGGSGGARAPEVAGAHVQDGPAAGPCPGGAGAGGSRSAARGMPGGAVCPDGPGQEGWGDMR